MEEPVSKSQKKREADALQKLGGELLALPAGALDKISLPANLRLAIDEARAIKSHGAIRRQMQLIGKLMRAADHEIIIAEYQEIIASQSATTALFHEQEQWRDRLISGGKEALTDFVASHPAVEVQHLRQLIKKAAEEKFAGKSSGAGKALFRFLRDLEG